MPINKDLFITEFTSFCKESMQWCMNESENEASNVYSIIHNLVDDLKRRSKMSEKTIQALQDLEEAIFKFLNDQKSNFQFSSLLKELNALKTDNQEIHNLINPIVECLQFQDRLRQNLQNISKIIDKWLEIRGKDLKLFFTSNEKLKDFGTNLLKCTTSQEEREIIRKHIKDLPSETKVEKAIIF